MIIWTFWVRRLKLYGAKWFRSSLDRCREGIFTSTCVVPFFKPKRYNVTMSVYKVIRIDYGWVIVKTKRGPHIMEAKVQYEVRLTFRALNLFMLPKMGSQGLTLRHGVWFNDGHSIIKASWSPTLHSTFMGNIWGSLQFLDHKISPFAAGRTTALGPFWVASHTREA